MSHVGDAENDLLDQLAEELREAFAERSYRVGSAIELDPGFETGDARSALERGIVLNALGTACGRIGIDFGPVNGRGRELRFSYGVMDRRYRVLRARRQRDGELKVPANSGSALADRDVEDEVEPGLFGDQLLDKRVLLWILSPDHRTIEEVLVAEVVGYIEGRPGWLVLGPARQLGISPTSVPPGFQPVDEDLDLEEDDLGEEDAAGDEGS